MSAAAKPALADYSGKTRDLYEWLDMAIKIITVAIGIVLAYQALATYTKEVNEKILEERIKTFDDAIKIAGQLAVAGNWETFGARLDEFKAINHGQVLASFGAGAIHEAMAKFSDKAVDIWNSEVDTPIPGPPEGALNTALENMAKQFNAVIAVPDRPGHDVSRPLLQH